MKIVESAGIIIYRITNQSVHGKLSRNQHPAEASDFLKTTPDTSVDRPTRTIIQYLLLHYAAGHWDFPKGHLENNESPEQAAQRELFEETGLKTDIELGFEQQISYFLTNPNGERIKKIVYFFVGRVKPNVRVKLSHEHTDFIWLPYEAAHEQLTYHNAKNLLSKADKFVRGQRI